MLPHMTNAQIGAVLAQWRTDCGETQSQTAERLGVTRGNLAGLEKGCFTIGLTVLARYHRGGMPEKTIRKLALAALRNAQEVLKS